MRDGGVKLSEDLVRHAVSFLTDDDLTSAFTATVPLVQRRSIMPVELLDQTRF
jgi:hypothetical protein